MKQPPRNPKRPKRPRRKTGKNVALQHSPRTEGRNANSTPNAIKLLFLEAYEKTCGNVSASCEYAGVDRTTFYRWMHSEHPEDIEFKLALEQIKPKERLLDVAESCLVQRMMEGSDHCITFTLKTQGKARGYIERAEIQDAAKQELEWQVATIRAKMDQRAKARGVSFQEELGEFMKVLGDQIKPEIRDRLVSEANN